MSSREADLLKEVQEYKRRAEKAEKLLRPTTLGEYLRLNHDHLFSSISVETDKSLTSKGGTTNPKERLYPRNLCVWKDFHEQQQETLHRLHAHYPLENDQRAFHHESHIKQVAEEVGDPPLATEDDLVYVQKRIVNAPVKMILNHLILQPAVRQEFGLDGQVEFRGQANALADNNEEVVQRNARAHPSTPVHNNWASKQVKTDQVCMYVSDDVDAPQRRLAYIIEYKAAHKLTPANLRLGLREDRTLDLKKDVLHEPKVPSLGDTKRRLQYQSDRLVAAAVTQLFSYMVETGTLFGYITTGEAFVFLNIPHDDPCTVRYHLIEPKADVAAQRKDYPDGDFTQRTALGQVLAFSLLALQSKPCSEDWRTQAMTQLEHWTITDTEIFKAMDESAHKETPPGSEYKPIVYRSPLPFKMNLRSGHRPGASTTPTGPRRRDGPDSDSGSGQGPSGTSARPPPQMGGRPQLTGRGSADRREDRSQGKGKERQRSYCTHACLRGIREADRLDPSCPNVDRHPDRDGRHAIDQDTLLKLLHQQLDRTLDSDCQPLGLSGARGALFRVSLASHGYTLVAKGTVSVFVPDLEHEARVYEQLRALQGTCVPVCLGNIDLVKPYHYDIGVRIVHMMFLSWAGRRIDYVLDDSNERHPRWESLVESAVRQIRSSAVEHKDAVARNLLWDERDGGRIMVIDFERSTIVREEPTTIVREEPSTIDFERSTIVREEPTTIVCEEPPTIDCERSTIVREEPSVLSASTGNKRKLAVLKTEGNFLAPTGDREGTKGKLLAPRGAQEGVEEKPLALGEEQVVVKGNVLVYSNDQDGENVQQSDYTVASR